MPKIFINGVVREMTPEEVEFFSKQEEEAPLKPEPDPNEVWKTEIEAALIELAAMMAGGV